MDTICSQGQHERPVDPPQRGMAPHDESNLDGFSLPGWIYHDAEFLAAERERVFYFMADCLSRKRHPRSR